MEVTTTKAEGGEAKNRPLTSTQRVYDAVSELRCLDQIATREAVAELTQLKLAIVDDRLRALVDDGRLKRLLRGIYELVETFPPPRPMWCGILPDGMVKFELGEHVIDMTPKEARAAHRALGGFGEDARILESTKQHLFLATELAAQVEKLKLEVRALRASKGDDRQLKMSL